MIGIPLIILVYILINVSFFAVLSIDEIINSESEAIAIVSCIFLVPPYMYIWITDVYARILQHTYAPITRYYSYYVMYSSVINGV